MNRIVKSLKFCLTFAYICRDISGGDDDDHENDENQSNKCYNYTVNDDQGVAIDTSRDIQKFENTYSTRYSSAPQTKQVNRMLKNLLVWNNAAGAYKTMSPLDRKQRRHGTSRN